MFKKILHDNIELVMDENEGLSKKEVLEIAKEWTLEEIERQVSQEIERYYWEYQDNINRSFFDA